MDLPKNKLGRTNLSVSRLGYGSMGIRGPRTWGIRVVDDQHAESFLNLVLDSGINFIDTSPDYGESEERIGRYIASRRNEYVLATKCGCVYTQHDDHLEIDHQWRSDVIERNLHTSLKRLQTDQIDLLQFHGGDAQTLLEAGLIDQLCGYRDEGLVRFIGVSTKLPAIKGLLELDVFDTIQLPYSCLANEHHEVMNQVAAKNVGVIVRGGVAQGGPDAEIQRENLNSVWNAAKLDELLEDTMSRAELILRYTLSQLACHTTIVGTCSESHLNENIASTMKGPLSNALCEEIQQRVAHASENM